MCGIIGAVGHDFDSVAAAVRALSHRGPDDKGTFEDRSAGVALGHTRLSIIDLSAMGHQPMVSPNGQVVLVFNGEIYNYLELRAALEASGTVFKGTSDTEVLLQLYVQEGVDCFKRLNGIFALAVYDLRTQELVVARDGMGVKPLYYTENEQGFAFSSEMKALSLIVKQTWSLDVEAVQRYMTFLWCPGDHTPAREVRKLGPGEALRVKAGRVCQKWQWYSIPQSRAVPVSIRPEAAIEEVRNHLRRAVHRQMIADVPVGAFLSGGLDSTSIVAFAREKAPDIQCFTIHSFDNDAGETEDLPYAKRAAQHLGVDLHVVEISPGRIASHLQQMVWQLDEPLADPASLNVLFIAELARANGIKVLLSGAGGDDLFTGYRRHLALHYEQVFGWLPSGIRRALGSASSSLDHRTSFGRRMSKLLRNAGANGDERLIGYLRWAAPEDVLKLCSEELRTSTAAALIDEPLLEYLAGMDPAMAPIDRMLALEQRFFLADHNLVYTDKMSMAAGVEVRVPFLDLELVELAARIPHRFKQNGAIGKWVLKKAMESKLPKDLIYRPKTGFGAPVRRWIAHDLREMVGDLLSPASIRKRGLFDPDAVQQLVASNQAGRQDAAYTILALLCIEIWCTQFIDAPNSLPAVRAAHSP